MADHEDIALSDDATLLDRFPMRDAEGNINLEFVEKIADAVHVADAAFLPSMPPPHRGSV